MTFIQRTLWFVVLLALQVFVFNHIHIMGYATPMPFFLLLLIFHSETPRWKYIVWGFAIGAAVDLFSKSLGEYAAVSTFLGLIAPKLRDAFAPADMDEEGYEPSARTMKWRRYALYAFFSTAIFCTLFYAIECFSFVHLTEMAINIAASTALTFIVIMAIEKIRK